MMRRKKTRRLFCLVLLVLSCLIGRPTFLWIRAWLHDKPAPHRLPPNHVDDASRLNRTSVAEVWSIPAEPAAAESQLRDLLRRSHAEHLSLSIAGARHSMGGHTISPDGIVLDMLPFNHMELDSDQRLLSVGAGARWSEVLPYLDAACRPLPMKFARAHGRVFCINETADFSADLILELSFTKIAKRRPVRG